MDNKDQAKGRVEQAIGDLTGDKDMKRHGKADEKAGDAKASIDKLNDKAHDLVDKATAKLTKD
jgi:uncharacterized protein YjbJ (UPF0337 family)